MTAFEILAVVLTLAGAFAYLNHRWIRLPPTIGLMALALVASMLMIVVDRLGWLPVQGTATRILERIAFGDTLLHGMLECSSLPGRCTSTSTTCARRSSRSASSRWEAR